MKLPFKIRLHYRLIVPVLVLCVGLMRAFWDAEMGLTYMVMAFLLYVWAMNADEIYFLKCRIDAQKLEIRKFHALKDR